MAVACRTAEDRISVDVGTVEKSFSALFKSRDENDCDGGGGVVVAGCGCFSRSEAATAAVAG